MNNFIGIGKIIDVHINGKVLKFTLAIKQEKPCYVPCLIFDPNDRTKDSMETLKASEQIVSLQGKISSYDFEYQGRIIRKIEVITYTIFTTSS